MAAAARDDDLTWYLRRLADAHFPQDARAWRRREAGRVRRLPPGEQARHFQEQLDNFPEPGIMFMYASVQLCLRYPYKIGAGLMLLCAALYWAWAGPNLLVPHQ